jgi:asparagine synthase (glutamine-hydrolysing)
MSAIAGIIRTDGRPVERAALERMQTLLTPYGEDAQNHSLQVSSAFLRTLLRTTPEDRLDEQPLIDNASGTTLLFDGRLDNREEIACALDIPPTQAMRMADSALVMRACLRWDVAAVEHLLGDYALACWQASRRRLWLARDPLGTRPLFWHQQSGRFAFATMPKALFALPGIIKALCEERLHDYLCLLPMTGPESFFKGIYRVEPGHTLTLEGERVTTHRFHRFDPEREIHLPNDDEYVEAFREQFDRAVACRLRAIGPVATHLSSGFDSSTVTAVAARQLAERDAPLLAYTAVPREGFSGPVPRGRHADEEPGARALAARFANIEHILVRTDGTSPVDSLHQDTEAMDRAPFNPCNMAWINAIRANAARRGAKVLLSGTMGNMTISYDGAPYLPALLGRGQWMAWWRENRALNRRLNVRWRRLLKYSLAAYTPVPLWKAFERYRGRKWDVTAHSAIHPDFMARMRTNDRARKNGWDLSYRPWSDGRRMRIASLNRFDNGDYFTSVNAMGLELRDPTADQRLIEFCLAVPESQYLRDGQSRWLLKRLMSDVLPPEIMHSRSRGLQAADWYEEASRALPQLRDEVARLMSHESAGSYLDLDSLVRVLEEWPETGWGDSEVEKTYRLKLLRGLAVGAFIRYANEGNK